FVLDPPNDVERHNLKLLTKGSEFVEEFSQIALRFTDTTYAEVKKSGAGPVGSCNAESLQQSQQATRKTLHYNLDGRILEDVLGSQPGGLFVAFIHGKRYSGKEVFAIDPRGAPSLIMPVAPEEVELVTYDDSRVGVWASFHYAEEYKAGTAT